MKRRFVFLLCWLVCQLSVAQELNQNYIQTRTMLDASGSRYIESVQYYDGLGRPSLLVQKGVTPSGNNLISLQEYDAFGRESKSWLPVPSSSGYLSASGFQSEASGYYGAGECPYGLNEYESSPLNRILKTYGPGKEWQTHPANVAYLTNTASGELACKHYQVSSSGALTDKGYYASGQLYVTKSSDEDGRVSYLFADKLGNQLLSRRMSGGVSHDTYYVYDDFGNKCFVLPPAYQDDPNLDLYAYQYKYDGRNREIEAKLPGCEPIYKVYDKADKLIFTQDGVQRAKGEWSFYLYDGFRRVIAGGICKNKSVNEVSEYIVTSKVYPKSQTTSTATTTVSFGESLCETNATLTLAEIQMANYYDNYSFLSQEEFKDRTVFPEATVNATGYQTGSLVRILGSDKVLANAIYYDTKGYPVREVFQNDMDGFDVRTTEYTFTGKPVIVHHNQTEKKIKGVLLKIAHDFKETYTYTYDHAERVTKVVHQMDDNVPVTLSENHYDELGRLSEKRLHGNDQLKSTYAYNLRSWLESIDSPLFSQQLYYDGSGEKPQYGGNITKMIWRVGNDKNTHAYDFTYDDLNRLTKASYTASIPMSEDSDLYTVSYQYNKMGSITGLIRRGLSALPSSLTEIDRLDLWYNGNHLRKVTDHASTADPLYNAAFNYVDGVDKEQEFIYDSNGNMIQDLDKGITLGYNSLNLTSSVKTKDMNVTYTYGADGTKHNSSYDYPPVGTEESGILPWYPSRPNPEIVPPFKPVSLQKLSTTHFHPGLRICCHYVQNAIRSDSEDVLDNLRTVFTEEGYITFSNKQPVYHYYLQDHQGNNRVVAKQDGTVEQVTHYYPYGGWFGESTNPTFQKHKYGGKELDLTSGLNTYDFGARTQRPDLGVFTTMDPLCEKYYDCSPYAYCGNNPMNRIDPTGMDWYRNSDGNYMWREGHEAIDGYENVGAEVSIQLGENSYLNCYQNGGVWANKAVNAFGLIRSSLKLQNQFLERKSALSAQSQTELLRAMNSRDIDKFARPIGEALVQFGAAELGGVFAGKLIGYIWGITAKGGAKTFFEGAKYTDKVLRQMDKADDVFHSFPKSVDGYATKFGQWGTKVGEDGKVYQWLQMPGSYGGKIGTFEYIKDANGMINHRFLKISK